MVIFDSYVSLPEGIQHIFRDLQIILLGQIDPTSSIISKKNPLVMTNSSPWFVDGP